MYKEGCSWIEECSLWGKIKHIEFAKYEREKIKRWFDREFQDPEGL